MTPGPHTQALGVQVRHFAHINLLLMLRPLENDTVPMCRVLSNGSSSWAGS